DPDRPDLALLLELGEDGKAVGVQPVPVGAVPLVEVDDVDAQVAQALLHCGAQVLRGRVAAPLLTLGPSDPTLGADDDRVTVAPAVGERPGHDPLVVAHGVPA